MSCHRSPANNLHLNVAQYISGAEPKDRRQIETLFHSLKREAKERNSQVESAIVDAPDLDPDARARIEAKAVRAPSQQEVLAHLERLDFQVRNDSAVPARRKPRLREYFDQAIAEVRAGNLPDVETWYAWQNLAIAVQRQQAERQAHRGNVAYDDSVVTEQDVLELAQSGVQVRPGASHGFHRRHVATTARDSAQLDALLALYDTTDEGFRRLEQGNPVLPDFPLSPERRIARAMAKRIQRMEAKSKAALPSAPLEYSQVQIRSAHNSFHVWRSACFSDPAMTVKAHDRDERWAQIEEAALRADRAARLSPSRIRERAIKRRGIRQTIDPTYQEPSLPDWLERRGRPNLR